MGDPMTDYNYFGYNEGLDQMPEGTFKISPSRLSRFLDKTTDWYRECVLGEAPMFAGSTASHLGTVVHGLAEMYHKTGAVDYSKAEAYIDSIADPEVDKNFIRQQYVGMSEMLINTFVAGKGGQSEPFLHHEVMPGISVGGSIDLLLPTEIVDYKTTSANKPPEKISREYWFQQMAYVWLARKKGMDIKTFRLVYVTTNDVNRGYGANGRPLKDYPSVVGSLVHEVTDNDYAIIDGTIHLVAESVAMYKNNPKMRHLLAQDMRLKEATTFLNR